MREASAARPATPTAQESIDRARAAPPVDQRAAPRSTAINDAAIEAHQLAGQLAIDLGTNALPSRRVVTRTAESRMREVDARARSTIGEVDEPRGKRAAVGTAASRSPCMRGCVAPELARTSQLRSQPARLVDRHRIAVPTSGAGATSRAHSPCCCRARPATPSAPASATIAARTTSAEAIRGSTTRATAAPAPKQRLGAAVQRRAVERADHARRPQHATSASSVQHAATSIRPSRLAVHAIRRRTGQSKIAAGFRLDVPDPTSRAVARVITRLNIGGPSIQATRLTTALAAHGFESTLFHGRLGAAKAT